VTASAKVRAGINLPGLVPALAAACSFTARAFPSTDQRLTPVALIAPALQRHEGIGPTNAKNVLVSTHYFMPEVHSHIQPTHIQPHTCQPTHHTRSHFNCHPQAYSESRVVPLPLCGAHSWVWVVRARWATAPSRPSRYVAHQSDRTGQAKQ
jgi:hypothetical protein